MAVSPKAIGRNIGPGAGSRPHSYCGLKWPVRPLIKATVVEPHLAIDEFGLAVLEFELVVVLSNEEQPAFTRVEMRIHTIQHVLVDHERADSLSAGHVIGHFHGINGGVPAQWRMVGVMLWKKLDQSFHVFALALQINHVLVDLRAERRDPVVEFLIA